MTQQTTTTSPRRAGWELFLISVLILFLELACIRWFPAHVLFLTFFTNMVLLACFLGMSVGCLTAGRARNFALLTPPLLLVAVVAAQGVESMINLGLASHLAVSDRSSPQVVYFGTENQSPDVARFVIPLEVLAGFFFAVLALAMIGPGQILGRALGRVPNRVQAYTINITGSLVGIVLFAACSWFELAPVWWFLPVVLGLAYFLRPGAETGSEVLKGMTPTPRTFQTVFRWGLLVLVLLVVSWPVGTREVEHHQRETVWSPYYRIDYDHEPVRGITVNLIGHQQMVARDNNGQPGYAYALPHLLHRDAQRLAGEQPRPFEDVLVIGAGSGNDVSRALQWGAGHVDAVEIDPVIAKIGARDHPDQPYQDPRVTVHLDDGRNFLRSSDRKYDLIVYALVDSLVLHSGYSNIRLESYLFTRQAFEDVHRHLKPGGLFVMYNLFRHGWVVSRLRQGLEETFGEAPLVMTLPYQKTVSAEEASSNFTTFLAGDGKAPIEKAFQQHGEYWVDGRVAPGADSVNGFQQPSAAERSNWLTLSKLDQMQQPWHRFAPAEVTPPSEPLRTATDDWPFLYLRRPMIPGISLRGAAIMGGVALLILLVFAPRRQQTTVARSPGLGWRMFFLGAGFMLIETKAVVHMALLFGSTWMVNSVVFLAVLLMILAANLFVLAVRPQRLWFYYVGLFATLLVNAVLPLDWFLGLDRAVQVAGSCLVVFAPILFAGVIFAVAFSRSVEPDRAFGANIAGAMLGGLAEYTSMLLGFQYLMLVAVGLYALSALAPALFRRKGDDWEPDTSAPAPQTAIASAK